MTRRLQTLPLLFALVAACSPPASPCDGGACNEGGDAGTQSRCITAVLPACDRGGDPYSDEACFALDDVESRTRATVDAMRAPTITAPTAGAALPAATPFAFQWTAPTALAPRTTPLRWRRASVTPALEARTPTALDELRRWTSLVPEAHAHCAPFSGLGYGLDFRANGRVVLRVEQSATSYTPSALAWDMLRAAGGPIEIRITAARFRNSTVSEGPFESPTRVTFTITP
ncbi:MAG: hypothetical protein JNK05_25755 [Myxococcales bacterium]|nr:hypothetical protein [Myxococcales bacterium]